LVPRSHIRALEEKAKKAAELEAQLGAMQRETVFARALGNLDHPGRSYFEKGYDGPLEVDAVRTAAADAGFLSKTPTDQSQTAPPPGLDPTLVTQFNAASTGAPAAGNQSWQEALAEADRISSQEEREAAILSVVERFGGVTSRTAQ
ncbi:MAG: hypothetical protein LC792_24225, partial [Actinobacteria bacterium]|nr:hypothetical protein [Actinomycetota bacterium]